MVLEGGRVFVRTYLFAIYHGATPPPTPRRMLTCEPDTKHELSDETDTSWKVPAALWVMDDRVMDDQVVHFTPRRFKVVKLARWQVC